MNQDRLVNIVSTVAMIVTLILGVLMTIAAIHQHSLPTDNQAGDRP